MPFVCFAAKENGQNAANLNLPIPVFSAGAAFEPIKSSPLFSESNRPAIAPRRARRMGWGARGNRVDLTAEKALNATRGFRHGEAYEKQILLRAYFDSPDLLQPLPGKGSRKRPRSGSQRNLEVHLLSQSNGHGFYVGRTFAYHGRDANRNRTLEHSCSKHLATTDQQNVRGG